MKPITKKKGWSLLLVLGILMPYLTGILPYIEVNAEPSTVKVTETILDTSDAKVDVTYEVAEKEITWQVDYTKHATLENVQRQLKLRIDDAASGLGTVRNLNRDAADSEGWYVLHDTYSSKEEKGSLTFKTDIQNFVEGSHYLNFTVQLDEKVSEELQVAAVTELQMIDEKEVQVEVVPATTEVKETVNSMILTEDEAGPHKVEVKPSLIAEVAPQEEVTEETSTEEIEQEAEVEGGVEAGDTEEEVATEEAAGESILMGPIQGLASRATVVNYQNLEPQYTTNTTGDNLGIFPTNNWGSENVRNHNGAETNSSWNPNSNDNFINYFAEGSNRDEADFGIKKYAQEVEGVQGLFDILLEVRGNTIDTHTAQPIDLLLVADRSGSMVNNQSTRWSNLKTGVNDFMNTIQSLGLQDTIHIGYVSFAESASSLLEIDTGQNSHKSIAIGTINDNESSINTQLGKRVAGGTNTHAGLLEAKNVLKYRKDNPVAGRENTKTVVVLLTDGVPTYHYQITEATVDTSLLDGVYVNAHGATDKGNGNNADLLPYIGNNNSNNREYYAKNSVASEEDVLIKNNFVAPVSIAKDLKDSGVEMRVIGIQLTAENTTNEGYDNFTEYQIEQRMQSISSPKPDGSGAYYYTNVDAASGIVSELSSIAHELSSTVSNAEINDPLGENILFQGRGLNITATQVSGDPLDGSQLPIALYNPATKTVSVSNIHAGKDQTVQIRYQVRIDTESTDFVPEKWYPANGRTLFTIEGNDVDFGVPSIKAPGVEVEINKEWQEDTPSDRPDNLEFTITRSSDNSTNLSGTVSLSPPASNPNSSNWSGTFNQMAVNSNQVFLAKFDNTGNDFTYDIAEEVLPDYNTAEPIVDGNVYNFVNTLKYQPMGLNILKVSDQGQTPLTGATFTLSGPNIAETITLVGDSAGNYTLPTDFVGMAKNGTYTLTETQAPTGHSLSTPSSWTIVMTNGVPTIGGQAVTVTENVIQYTVENPFNELSLEVAKLNGAIPLDGATFVLAKDGVQIGEQVSDEGLVSFSNLTPGSYTLTETVAPAGYELADPAEWTFTIDDYGQLNGEGFTLDGFTIYKEVQNNLKDFDLTINKIDEQGEALLGAEFTLTMPSNSSFSPIVLGTDGTLSEFVFENLSPGTYQLEETKNPSTHIMLENPIIIVIDNEGNVTVDGDENLADVVLTTDASNNTITFDVTNEAKTPLPATGGMGTPIFFILGGLLMLMVGIAVFQVKRNRKGAF